VREAYSRVSEGKPIAVRSSATDEDGLDSSFAGQLSSFLFVMNSEDALHFSMECLASTFSERALIYRREKGLLVEQCDVAVIFQKMVDPSVSGVLFTSDP